MAPPTTRHPPNSKNKCVKKFLLPQDFIIIYIYKNKNGGPGTWYEITEYPSIEGQRK